MPSNYNTIRMIGLSCIVAAIIVPTVLWFIAGDSMLLGALAIAVVLLIIAAFFLLRLPKFKE